MMQDRNSAYRLACWILLAWDNSSAKTFLYRTLADCMCYIFASLNARVARYVYVSQICLSATPVAQYRSNIWFLPNILICQDLIQNVPKPGTPQTADHCLSELRSIAVVHASHYSHNAQYCSFCLRSFLLSAVSAIKCFASFLRERSEL